VAARASRRDSGTSITTADLDAFVAEQSADAARRFASFADAARAKGAGDLAALFEVLQAHAPHVPSPRDGVAARVRAVLPPGLADLGAATEEAMRSALLTPYRALAAAVRETGRRFAAFAQIAAAATAPDVRTRAEELARGELARAAALRKARRRAYHAERPAEQQAPATVETLRNLGAAWEQGTEGGSAHRRQRAAEAFERYLWVAEHAPDERVISEAQARAAAMLERILGELPATAPQR
jgi:hypothetical protein